MGCRSLSNTGAQLQPCSSGRLGELSSAATFSGVCQEVAWCLDSLLAVDSLFQVCPRRWLLLA